MLACPENRPAFAESRARTARVLLVPAPVIEEARSFLRDCPVAGTDPEKLDAAALRWPCTRKLGALLRSGLRRGEGCRRLSLPLGCALSTELRRLLFLAIGAALGAPQFSRPSGEGDADPQHDRGSYLPRPRFRTEGGSASVPPHFVGVWSGPGAQEHAVLLSQALRVRQKIANHAPAVWRVLQRGYLWEPHSATNPDRVAGSMPCGRIPVFAADDEPAGWTMRYARDRVERGHAQAGEPLHREEVAAFDLLDELLGDPDHVLRVQLAAGDMLWFNNRILAHAYSASHPPASADTRLEVLAPAAI